MTLRYEELALRTDFTARFRYAVLGGTIGVETFGYDRFLNQKFYASKEWKDVRREVIIRDHGCDLGIPGREIHDKVLVHHMNPISVRDLIKFNPDIINPDFLVCVSTSTHNAIHFGDESQLPRDLIERRPGDTFNWPSIRSE